MAVAVGGGHGRLAVEPAALVADTPGTAGSLVLRSGGRTRMEARQGLEPPGNV